jgi:BirA family transcriptional regulator, biotin operon repressor / biotin---[acetyl-CoA-carboxylase] ligase
MIALNLPPPYRAAYLAQGQPALAAARAAAAAGVEAGALFWGLCASSLGCALVLRPNRSRRDTLPLVYVAALAVADALGAFAAPTVPIAFRWPDGIVIDGGLAGRVSFASAPGAANAVPGFAVVGFELAVATGDGEPGHSPYVTSIAEEGFGEFSAAGLIEGFGRHFLRWLARLDAEGFAWIGAEWWRRAFGAPVDPAFDPTGAARITPLALDSSGNLRVTEDGRERILRLGAALGDASDDA